MRKHRKALKAAFPHTIPVMTGYLFIGIAFGILLQSKGYHFGWAILMSTLIYAGSMQFVAVGLLTGGFDIAAAFFMTLTVNIRHIFYGISMLEGFKDLKAKKPYMIFALTDETFSLLCSVKPPYGVDRDWFLFYIALLNQCYWIIGSAAGAVLGTLLSFNTKGIDFVMTALFVVIFVEQWKDKNGHIPALTGLIVSGVCLFLFGASNLIVPSMIAILAVLTLARPSLEARRKV